MTPEPKPGLHPDEWMDETDPDPAPLTRRPPRQPRFLRHPRRLDRAKTTTKKRRR